MEEGGEPLSRETGTRIAHGEDHPQSVHPSLNGGSNPAAPLKNDADILNFALLLEYLEAEFYNLNVPTFFK